MKELVVLVDENDHELGVMEKLQAHHEGKLHRAISVFIFNSKKEMLLQKRAANKYHSANLWSNACCSHPFPNEKPIDAAKRRLKEEMGITCDLRHAFNFIYSANLENGLSENEFDHVFIGETDDIPLPDPTEVSDWKYFSEEKLKNEMKENPQNFSVWFKMMFEKVVRAKD